MPIDWDKFDKDLGDIVKKAADATDEQLAEKIASVTRMTAEEVQSLFPEPADVKKLAELMKIVKSSEERNTKVQNIVANAEAFGGVMLTLLANFT
jgi:hypothetical protein